MMLGPKPYCPTAPPGAHPTSSLPLSQGQAASAEGSLKKCGAVMEHVLFQGRKTGSCCSEHYLSFHTNYVNQI